jgi:hypothetical protein
MTIYEENGHKNRQEYLLSLADDYGLNPELVFAVADVLGKDEDFDGLISTLEDAEYFDGMS